MRADHLGDLPDRPLVVGCPVGLRGHVATRILLQEGREARNLGSGYRTWSAAGGASERENDAENDAAAPPAKEE